MGKKEGDACDSYIESENQVGSGRFLTSCDNAGWFDWLDPHSGYFEKPIAILKKSGGKCWLSGNSGSSLNCRENVVESKKCEDAYYFHVPDNYFHSFGDFLSHSSRKTLLARSWFIVSCVVLLFQTSY